MIGLLILAFLAVLAGSPAGAAAAPVRTAAAADSSGAPGIALAVAGVAPDSLASAAGGRPVITLPEVRVDRARLLSEARRRLPTAFVTDLRAGASGRAFESVSEILEQAAGVRVVQYGGLGAFSTVSLRGAPPGHVAVYLDGVPLTSAAHGVVSLSDLPAGAIDRVEVYRGPSPLEFGQASPGGAINLVTVASPALREARLTRGSFGTWEARGTGGASRGAFSGLIHGGYQGSRGDFRFLDGNGTPANPEDDEIGTRANNRFEALAALATVAFAPRSGLRARFREDLFRRRQGVPGLGADQALHTRLEFQRAISHLEIELGGGGLVPETRLQGSLQRERTRFRDLGLELHLGRHDTDDRLASDLLSLATAWRRLPLGLSIETGGSLRRERATLSDAADGLPDPPPSRRFTAGARVGLQLRPLGERLTLHAARRWDRVEDRLLTTGLGGGAETRVTRELDSPQIGMRLAVARGLELRANASRAERPPDFLELFGNQGSVLGNPKLVPEHGESWDAGAAWEAALGPRLRAAVEWAHFESRTRDLILYVQNSPSSVKAQNVSRALVRGEELSLRLRGPARLGLTAALTRQSSVDQGTISFYRGRRLPQRPERQAYARFDWTPGRVGAALDVQYIGDDYLDRYNRNRAAPRTLLGASLSFAPWRGGPRLTVEGKNLRDDRVADVAGFPLPGRSVFASLEWQLDEGAPGRP